jgi:epoxyqueuosine reductase
VRNSLGNELSCLLRDEGVDMVNYVDVSALPVSLNKGFPVAVLLGMKLTADYLLKVLLSVNYVQEMKSQNRIYEDEFHTSEIKTDRLADFVAGFLVSKGYSAYSQSEKNLLAMGSYNTVTHTTVLPHKTIALLAGMGWIGKHDLLVTPEYGSAISMCTVLTDAPLPATLQPVSLSCCGDVACNFSDLVQIRIFSENSFINCFY